MTRFALLLVGWGLLSVTWLAGSQTTRFGFACAAVAWFSRMIVDDIADLVRRRRARRRRTERGEDVELAPWARIPSGMWAEVCHHCERTPPSLFYACEGCPRLTPEMGREWRELHGFDRDGAA